LQLYLCSVPKNRQLPLKAVDREKQLSIDSEETDQRKKSSVPVSVIAYQPTPLLSGQYQSPVLKSSKKSTSLEDTDSDISLPHSLCSRGSRRGAKSEILQVNYL